VTSKTSDHFAWFAYNDNEDHLLHQSVSLHFDGSVDIETMSVDDAVNEYGQTDVPNSVPLGTVERFYYGS